jgi:hypothetical protein
VASATRTTQGTLDTAIPNLFYRSMHHDALRLEDGYVALPQEPVLSGPESLRCVFFVNGVAVRVVIVPICMLTISCV